MCIYGKGSPGLLLVVLTACSVDAGSDTAVKNAPDGVDASLPAPVATMPGTTPVDPEPGPVTGASGALPAVPATSPTLQGTGGRAGGSATPSGGGANAVEAGGAAASSAGAPPGSGGAANAGDIPSTAGAGGQPALDGRDAGSTAISSGGANGMTPGPSIDASVADGCSDDEQCADLPATPVCDVQSGSCVGCVSNDDCTRASASTCVDNECTRCVSDADCAHLGVKVCDDGGRGCVQCTGTKDDACDTSSDEYACDSLSHTCPERVPINWVGVVNECHKCISDAHCKAGQVCVRTQFEGEPVPGWKCMWEQGAVGAPADCATEGGPYRVATPDVTTIDGREVTICALALASCDSFLDGVYFRCDPSLDATDQCGVPGLDDGLCRPQPGDDANSYCTVRCESDDDCLGYTCGMDETPAYCQFPRDP